MDKETLSNYGWIVICVLVMVVMIALASPFGNFVASAIKSTTQGLFDVNQSALNSTGLIDIGDQSFGDGEGEVPPAETKPDFSHLTTVEGCPLKFGRAYVNEELSMALLPFADGAALVGWPGWGWATSNAEFYPAGSLVYDGTNVMIEGMTIATCNEDGTEVYYDGYTFTLEPVLLGTNNYCSHTITRYEALDYVATYTFGVTEKYTGDTYCAYCDELVDEGECTHITTEIQNAKDATCSEEGYTGDTVCVDCNKKIFSGTVIASGHTDNNADNACDRCGANYYENGTLVFEIDNIAYLYGNNSEVITTYTGWNVATYSSSVVPPWYENRSSITKVVIKDGVSLYSLAFWFRNCTNLTSVIIPEGITILGNYAFSGCTNLVSISIPDSVSATGQYAFSGCKSLKQVTFGTNSQLYGINDSAFQYCTSLTSIIIPSNAKQFNSYAFYGCTSLANIEFKGTVEQWAAIAKYTAWNANVPATYVQCSDGQASIS